MMVHNATDPKENRITRLLEMIKAQPPGPFQGNLIQMTTESNLTFLF